MGLIFFIPLTSIAFYESTFDTRKHTWMESWFRGKDEGPEDSPENRDPIVDDPTCEGLEISKVPFSELIQVFPNTTQVIFFTVGVKMHLKLNVYLFSRAKQRF
jgi:hypothetical protein